jgi:glycosyltransferase involved in cell wall biosynthesis
VSGAGERREPRTVVSYPGVMPAATQVARALEDAGLLLRFETTLALLPARAIDRTLSVAVQSVLGARGHAELSRRALSEVPAHRVRRTPGWEILRVAAVRLGAGEVLADRAWEQSVLRFDAAVARRLGGEVQAVYGYEHACLSTFGRARALGAARLFDLAAPHHTFVARMLDEQHAAYPELHTAYRAATAPLDERRNQRKQAELELASLVVANSSFTARTLIETGFPAERVRVVPLGAPPVDPSYRQRPRPQTVRFLFAGAAGPRKGAHLLIDAFRRLGTRRGVELVIAGQWLLPSRMRATLPAGVRVLGSVPQPQLFEEYRRASVLVFPSVCDGFGMVVTEALAHGLPVITTRHVGAADLIEDGVSGFVIAPSDVDALTERMAHCVANPELLWTMRQGAEDAAAKRQWSDYRAQLVATLIEHHASRASRPVEAGR